MQPGPDQMLGKEQAALYANCKAPCPCRQDPASGATKLLANPRQKSVEIVGLGSHRVAPAWHDRPDTTTGNALQAAKATAASD